jgi:hypothetical protein
MKLLLIKALADDHLYSQFAEALRRALMDLGHEAVISDQSVHVAGGVALAKPLADEVQRSRSDVVVSFGSFFGGARAENGDPLFDALGVKFLGWQLDHPVLAPGSLARQLRNRYAVYSNDNHLRFAKAIKLPGRGVAMLPGGEPPQAPLKEFRSREWPIFVAATFNGPPQAPWEQLPDSPGKRLLTAVLRRLAGDKQASLLDAFNDASRKLGLGARLGDDPAFDDEMIAFLRQPLNYLRGVDRIDAIKALADSGLPLTICGPGWRELLGDRPNLTYLNGRVAFADLPSLYNNAKIVLNLNAGNGACERAVYAALAGAAVVSDHSEQLERLFKSREEATYFNRARPGDIVQAMSRLVESDGGEAVAQRAREKAGRSGLWRHRAQQVVDFLQRP